MILSFFFNQNKENTQVKTGIRFVYTLMKREYELRHFIGVYVFGI